MFRNYLTILTLASLFFVTYGEEKRSNELKEDIEMLRNEIDSIKSEISQAKAEKKKKENSKEGPIDRLRKERADTEPYQLKRKKKVIYGFRFTSVGPYDDDNPHILITQSLGFMGQLNEHVAVGIQEFTIDVFSTIKGSRFTMSAAPVAEFSFCPKKWLQIGSKVGTIIAGHASEDESSTSAVVPFVSIFNQYWVLPRFSFGPEIQLNSVLKGDHHLNSVSTERASMMPQKSVWFDTGIQFSYHF